MRLLQQLNLVPKKLNLAISVITLCLISQGRPTLVRFVVVSSYWGVGCSVLKRFRYIYSIIQCFAVAFLRGATQPM